MAEQIHVKNAPMPPGKQIMVMIAFYVQLVMVKALYGSGRILCKSLGQIKIGSRRYENNSLHITS
ncbi:MAG TPA: hypothetical protein VE732_01815 [Nitrososphaera sp.]|nr:hypothetical protein [Nitrososphaera sp.]